MNSVTKRFATGLVLGAASLGLMAGTALAEEEKPTADFTVSALSQYVWRGFAYTKDSVVIQPSMTVGYKGFAANVWGNLDTDRWNDSGQDSNNWTETDLTFSYDWTMGPVGMSGGYIYYALDSDTDSQEVYLSAALDTLLSPTLTVYRDIDHLTGWYITLGVSHSIPLKGDIALDLGAQVSYLDADDGSSYGEVVNGVESTADDYSNFHDGLLSASVTFPVNEYIAVTPELNYSFPLSSDAEDLLKVRNASYIGRNDDDFVYGGVSVSLAF